MSQMWRLNAGGLSVRFNLPAKSVVQNLRLGGVEFDRREQLVRFDLQVVDHRFDPGDELENVLHAVFFRLMLGRAIDRDNPVFNFKAVARKSQRAVSHQLGFDRFINRLIVGWRRSRAWLRSRNRAWRWLSGDDIPAHRLRRVALLLAPEQVSYYDHQRQQSSANHYQSPLRRGEKGKPSAPLVRRKEDHVPRQSGMSFPPTRIFTPPLER